MQARARSSSTLPSGFQLPREERGPGFLPGLPLPPRWPAPGEAQGQDCPPPESALSWGEGSPSAGPLPALDQGSRDPPGPGRCPRAARLLHLLLRAEGREEVGGGAQGPLPRPHLPPSSPVWPSFGFTDPLAEKE